MAGRVRLLSSDTEFAYLGAEMKPDGGPAFPLEHVRYEQGDGLVMNRAEMDGMTLRDYFAARCITSTLNRVEKVETIAKWAYELADAMLAERAKEPK